MIKYCHCGRKLHYTDVKLKRKIESINTKFGDYMQIKANDNKTYLVQRHYIALHGIRDKDLRALGFTEIDYARHT